MSTQASTVWNVPNRLSAARIVFAIVCFGCLSAGQPFWALALFVLAAITDWLDGYWARRFDQITQLGRVLDPFADKLLICGVFVYLAATPGSGVGAWVAVVVLARELLVTALRSFVEAAGGDFSAKWAGKWKMVLQCATAIGSLWLLATGNGAPGWLLNTVRAGAAATVAVTLYSGYGYVRAAIDLSSAAASGESNAATDQTSGEGSG